jgi:hypothetical protein
VEETVAERWLVAELATRGTSAGELRECRGEYGLHTSGRGFGFEDGS